MQAIHRSRYGSPDVLTVVDTDRPRPGSGEVLVRLKAAAVCKGDVHVLAGRPYLVRLMGFGLFGPRHPGIGQEISGVVAAVGDCVTQFKIGDEVFGEVSNGGFAQYVAAPEERIALKPKTMSFEEAAGVPVGGLTALNAIRTANVVEGERVLINGASGGVGTFAIQIAKARGGHVTAVCSSRNVDQARTLGADEVIDYRREDFVKRGQRYNAIIDIVGNRSKFELRRLLTRSGRCSAVANQSMGDWLGPISWMVGTAAFSLLSGMSTKTIMYEPNRKDLEELRKLADNGKLTTIVEKRFPLSQASEALRHVAQGHAQGKSILIP